MCIFATENTSRMLPVGNTPLQKNAMNHNGVKDVLFCTFFSKNATFRNCPNNYNQSTFESFGGFTFTGKERDEETGYGYFGARYMDHELMTMWLSVDPMADKYPGISPYAYCAWNPIILVDSDGMKFDSVSQVEVDKLKRQAAINLYKGHNGDIESLLYQREYEATLSEISVLENSDQEYHVRNRGRNIKLDGFKDGAAGRTIYKNETDKVMMVYNGNLGTLAHELKHAYQFEIGNTSFDATGYSGGVLNDFYDEREAYDRGAAFGRPVRTDEFIRLNYKLPSTKTTIESRHSNGNSIIDLLNRKGNVYRKDGVTYKAGVKVPSK